jgi:hypothetical protein
MTEGFEIVQGACNAILETFVLKFGFNLIELYHVIFTAFVGCSK